MTMTTSDPKRHSSPHTTKRPRVRKLQPLASHGNRQSPPRQRDDPFGHMRAEIERLQKLMAAAVATRNLKQVEAIMEQLLTLAERRTNHELISYLESCEADLKALVEQEERERKHQRFVANGLMTQVVGLLHAGGVDDTAAMQSLLDQAEAAYRRARDKRAECLPAIRHRVTAGTLLAEATRRFEEGDLSRAIVVAHAASDAYSMFRSSPSYAGSQLLLTLSEPSNAWDGAPLRELSHPSDDLDRCFADIEGFFQDKARTNGKLLFADSIRWADERQYPKALDGMERCGAIYKWLGEPVPPAITKWTRQLSRLEITRTLQRLEAPTLQPEVPAQLLKWTIDCEHGVVQKEDLVECGAMRFTLQFASTLNDPAAAATVVKLLKCVGELQTAADATFLAVLRQGTDTKTIVMALTRLAETLEAVSDRVRILHVLWALLDSRQSTHIAIHKCDILAAWTRLREANNATPDVLVVLVQVLHSLLTLPFAAAKIATTPRITNANVIRGVVAIFVRYFKLVAIASACVEVLTMLCTSRDICLNSLVPTSTGLSSAIVHALRHYAQQSPTQARLLVLGLAAVLQILCTLDLSVAKSIDVSKIPALVASLGSHAPWSLPSYVVRFFEPHEFSRIVQEGGHFPETVTIYQAPSTTLSPGPSPLTSATIKRVCVATFGVSILVIRRRQFCIVRFLVPEDPSSGVDQCQLEVTHLCTHVQIQVFQFPSSGEYSTGMLRRELTRASDTRTDLLRMLMASMQPRLVRGVTVTKKFN